MSPQPVPFETLVKRAEAYHRHGTAAAAARELGIDEATVRRAVQALRDEDIEITKPDIPEDDIPIDEIIGTMERRFSARKAHRDAKAWMPIKVNTDQPIVKAFVGDPHLDDNGCNWPLLRRDIELLSDPNVLSVNIGDTTNNWTGRLMRLYAKQDTSLKTARKLAKWFLHDSGVNWLMWLIGNHDDWEHGHAILDLINADHVIMENWQCRYRMVFQNGFTVPVHVAHDFQGNSQWNKLHGPMKKALMGGGAGLYVCGHKHTWGIHSEEVEDTGTVFHAMRVRGYKFLDEYAHVNGYAENQLGATMAVVIDPREKSPADAVTPFTSLEKALDYRNAIAA